MQSKDATTAFLFKLWPWIEANKKRVIIGTGISAAAIFLFSFFSWQHEQNEIAAGRALTQLAVSIPSNASADQMAGAYLKIAGDYPGTPGGRRAWLQGAAALFAAGKFADAQAQFQKYLDAHPDGDFSASAALGVAASLVVNTAKFALARIAEQQGKFTDALNFYENITRSAPGSVLAQEAGMRA